MPNWVQLVEHTAEYIPTPWDVYSGDVDNGNRFELLRGRERTPFATVHPTRNGHHPEMPDGRLSGSWDDIEQEATGRLLFDAPEMLSLLARWANFGGPDGPRLGADQKEYESMLSATEALIRRHVRIGCVPVDAESRADRPSPYPGGDVSEWLNREGK